MTTETALTRAYVCLTTKEARSLAAELLRIADRVEAKESVGIAEAYGYARDHELTAETGAEDFRVRLRISNDRPARS